MSLLTTNTWVSCKPRTTSISHADCVSFGKRFEVWSMSMNAEFQNVRADRIITGPVCVFEKPDEGVHMWHYTEDSDATSFHSLAINTVPSLQHIMELHTQSIFAETSQTIHSYHAELLGMFALVFAYDYISFSKEEPLDICRPAAKFFETLFDPSCEVFKLIQSVKNISIGLSKNFEEEKFMGTKNIPKRLPWICLCLDCAWCCSFIRSRTSVTSSLD